MTTQKTTEIRRQAVSYERVSTYRQEALGQSLENQADTIQAYCKRRGYELIDSFSDSSSAREGKHRPGLEQAIALTKQVRGILVVYDFSRLSRSLIDCIGIRNKLAESGAQIAFTAIDLDTTTAVGRMIFGILASVAEMESSLISERVAAANQYTIKKTGRRTQGRQAFGVRVIKGIPTLVPEEMKIVTYVKEVVQQTRSYKEAAIRLAAEGVPTPAQFRGHKKESKWTSTGCRRIAMREYKAAH